jgi:F-type H+-transporting ATPase subunit a
MWPFFPLNVVGKVAEVASVSFRLFGNIFGGAVIILIASFFTANVVLPLPLAVFFGLFVGTIQAFVFTMLTLVYISVQIR